MKKLVIIDDHFLILEGICKILESEGFYSETYDDVGKAIIGIAHNHIDLILLDLFIRKDCPVQNLSKLKVAFPHIPVAILSSESSNVWQAKMFQKGVKAYINKSETKASLLMKINEALNGRTFMPDDIKKIIANDHFLPYEKIPGTIELVKLLSEGYDLKAIAKKMDQSVSSIEKRLKKLRLIHKQKTNCQLVYHFLVQNLPELKSA